MKRVWLFAVMIMLLSLNVGLANKAIVPSDVQSFNDELKEHLAAQKARIELGKRTFETILREQGQEQMLTGDDYDEALSNFLQSDEFDITDPVHYAVLEFAYDYLARQLPKAAGTGMKHGTPREKDISKQVKVPVAADTYEITANYNVTDAIWYGCMVGELTLDRLASLEDA